jgi:hypothetical protein
MNKSGKGSKEVFLCLIGSAFLTSWTNPVIINNIMKSNIIEKKLNIRLNSLQFVFQ